jgi:hypothetical protein
MSEGKKTIVEIVEELKNKKGVTHEDIYPAIGLGRSAYYDRIRLIVKFKPHEAMALAKYFKVDYEAVFGGFFDPKLVVGEPRVEYMSAKEELLESYRKLDKLHDDLECALKREVKYITALAKAGVDIPK